MATKPRTSGLWMADCPPGRDLDATQVEKARLHLVELLRDPYYSEAAIRLNRSGKFTELIDDHGGTPKLGGIAHERQHPKPSKPKQSGPGRPKDDLLKNPTMLLDEFEKRNVPGQTQIGWCRLVLCEIFPTAHPDQLEIAAKEISRKMSDIRRRRLARN